MPLSLAEQSNKVWECLLELAECGNINCKSDLQVQLQSSFTLNMHKKSLNVLMLIKNWFVNVLILIQRVLEFRN